MAIVKMKKIRVMAMASDREELLNQLLRLGCVEISEPDDKLADPEWTALVKRGTSDLMSAKSEITDANTALSALKRYAELKDGMFIKRHPITEKEFLGAGTVDRAREVSAKIGGLLQDLSRLQGEFNRLLTKKAGLLPWKDLDLPLETEDTEHVVIRLGVCPGATDLGAVKARLDGEGVAAELLEVSASKLQRNLLLICHRADEEKTMGLLRPFGFSVTAFQGYSGTPAENLARLSGEAEENDRRQRETVDAIIACKEAKGALQVYTDRLAAEAAKEADAERLLTDGTIVFFEGWAPASSMDKLEKFLAERGCAWEAEDPKPEDYPRVPVKLKNNLLTRPLNMVTEMYSLPAYDGVDPNPLMAPFFIFFYGFMMSDIAYGLLMMIFAAVVLKKYHPKGGTYNFFALMGICGFTAFVMGFVTGGFLGDFLPQLARVINPNTTFTGLPALFTPLNDTLMILVGSMCFGAVQIITGMTIKFVKLTKEGHLPDALMDIGSWWLVFIGIGVGALAGNWWVAIAGAAALVLTQGRDKPTVIGKIVGGVGSLYSITGYFGDILSYSRLMALMLAGSVIAQVFNTLGAIPGNLVFFLIISLVGNTLNFALNLLSCYVHDLRLQCLEYFGKFYQDGGKPFRPLEMKTKFVDIVKE